jgi:hypothetical protein
MAAEEVDSERVLEAEASLQRGVLALEAAATVLRICRAPRGVHRLGEPPEQ